MFDLERNRIVSESRFVAVVGLSPKPNRPSNQVALYLIQAGFTVYPVNPGHNEILGLPCFPNLEAIPGPVDIVDIFRNPLDVPPIVDSAIAIGANTIWMQQGIVHEDAAKKARLAGLSVIMDRCLKVDHRNLKKKGRSG